MKTILKIIVPKAIKYRLLNFYGRILLKLVGPYSTAILARSDDFIYLTAVNDMSVGRSLRNSGEYSKEEVSRLKNILTSNSNVVVVGTHIGAIAIPLSRYVKKLICFEANPDTYPILQLNLLLNKCFNVVPNYVAIGEKDGEIEFVCSNTFSGGAKRKPVTNIKKYNWDNSKLVTVPLTTLDNNKNVEQLPLIDLLLMDIEGSEYYALKGSPKTLAKTKNLVMEFIPHHLKNVGNINVQELLEKIVPHFNYFKLSNSEEVFDISMASKLLTKMYNNDIGDPGILFIK